MSDLPGIVVTGVSGRMGQMLVQTIAASGKARLVGALERSGHDWIGQDLGRAMGGAESGIVVGDDPVEAFAKAQAVIDFTAPAASVAFAGLAAQAAPPPAHAPPPAPPAPPPPQIKGAHLFQKAKRALLKGRPIPIFNEEPIPEVSTLALEDIDVSNPFLFRQNRWQSYFKRLRDECPVHYQQKSPFGPFWSVTRYEDIMFVDKHHDLFSAEPIISIGGQPEGLAIETFIAMDPPKHDAQRHAVQGVVAPKNLKEMEGLIRNRAAEVLDSLPVGEPFDWVEKVSIELTSRMLATLFDFPYDQRHKLAYWSDVAASSPETTGGTGNTHEAFTVAAEVAKQFSLLWREKEAKKAAGEKMGFDLEKIVKDFWSGGFDLYQMHILL